MAKHTIIGFTYERAYSPEQYGKERIELSGSVAVDEGDDAFELLADCLDRAKHLAAVKLGLAAPEAAPVEAKPKAKRRTKAEIAADKVAAEIVTESVTVPMQQGAAGIPGVDAVPTQAPNALPGVTAPVAETATSTNAPAAVAALTPPAAAVGDPLAGLGMPAAVVEIDDDTLRNRVGAVITKLGTVDGPGRIHAALAKLGKAQISDLDQPGRTAFLADIEA